MLKNAEQNKEESIRILHVDNDFSFLEKTKFKLNELNSNLTIDFALSATEAFKTLAKNEYDLIISEYDLPQKNGLEFFRDLKVSGNNLPFILFTNKREEEILIEALNLGVDGYLNKQGNPEPLYSELTNRVRTVFETTKTKPAPEDKFAKAFNYASNAIMITQISDGKIIDANDSLSDLLGYPHNELIGKTPLDLGLWVDQDDLTQIIKASSKDFIRNREVLLKRKDGSVINAIGSFSTITVGTKQLFLSGLFDVTEIKKTEVKLRDSEAKYRILSENSRDIIWAMTLDGHYTYISPSVFPLRGYTQEEAVNQSLSETLTPESTQIVLEAFQKYFETREIPKKYFELEALCKDGSTVWIQASFSVITDKDGYPELILGASRDITELKKAEKEIKKNQRQLEILNKKLQIIGGLTRHDVRNKLTAIRNNIYLIKKKSQNNPEILKHLVSIEKALSQSEEIFEFSRLYEQIGAEKFEISVSNEFEAAVKLRPHDGVEIINDTQGLIVLADNMLQKMFYNLIDNSLKHGQKVSKISLSYDQINNDTRIIYQDDGVGVSQENKSKIFLGGFTTGGLGLGLKLIKSIIDVYEWTITEEGIENKGAKFVITVHG